MSKKKLQPEQPFPPVDVMSVEQIGEGIFQIIFSVCNRLRAAPGHHSQICNGHFISRERAAEIDIKPFKGTGLQWYQAVDDWVVVLTWSDLFDKDRINLARSQAEDFKKEWEQDQQNE